MIIYSNGCSHTQGHCIQKTYDIILAEILFKKKSVNKYRFLRSSLEFFKEYESSVMDRVVQNLDKDFIYTQAIAGKSNNLIFLETYHFVTNCIKKNIKIDYIIIQTSGPNRRFHSTSSGDYQEVNPHSNWKLGLKFEPWATLETLQWIYLLQKLFLEHEIPYVFVPYMELDEESYNLSPYIDLIDWAKFTTNPLFGHRNDFRKRGDYTCDEAGHPNAYGYHYLAKLCLEIISPESELKDISNYYDPESIKYAPIGDPWRREFISNFSNELDDGTPSRVKRLMKVFKKDLL